MAILGPQFDILLEQDGPGGETSGRDDVRALWKYVIEVFEEGSPVRAMILKAVSKPAREVYMTIEEALLARGEARGEARGRAAAVLDLLELRALPIPPPVRERVLSTRDEPQLRRWLARAITITSADELFEACEA